jgi:NAD(P)-dependent dehydrogenase (short-subunit alcohol dehydrogenase family)
MSKTIPGNNLAEPKAYIITGPTSGIGLRTALELARHGAVVLVGRDRGRLDQVRKEIERMNQRAVPVLCDLSDLGSVRRAVAEIIALDLRKPSRWPDRCWRGIPVSPPGSSTRPGP